MTIRISILCAADAVPCTPGAANVDSKSYIKTVLSAAPVFGSEWLKPSDAESYQAA